MTRAVVLKTLSGSVSFAAPLCASAAVSGTMTPHVACLTPLPHIRITRLT
jgi:hypothetical protein